MVQEKSKNIEMITGDPNDVFNVVNNVLQYCR